jgi:hypothetical protein
MKGKIDELVKEANDETKAHQLTMKSMRSEIQHLKERNTELEQRLKDAKRGTNGSNTERSSNKTSVEREDGRYISGAGLDAVNGWYVENGEYDSVKKYMKTGVWKGEEQVFSLFQHTKVVHI